MSWLLKFVGIATISLGLGFLAKAQQAENPSTNRRSPSGYSDGDDLDAHKAVDKSRQPSGELPYSDDELQKNLPENYGNKNMPVDKD